VKTVKALKEEIASLFSTVQAMVDLAESEKRDLSDQEQADIDAIMGVGTKGEDGYKAGKMDRAEAELARMEKIEARALELRRDRTPAGGPPGQGDARAKETLRIKQIFRHQRLKAFKGDNGAEQAYKSGRFLMATLFQHRASANWCREHGVGIEMADVSDIKNVQIETDDSLGGFLVPEEMETAIIDLREEFGVFRSNSRVVPMGSDTKTVPVRSSGVTAYYVDENTAVTESDAKWDQVKLIAKSLAALTRHSRDLSDDAVVDIGDTLTGEMAYAFTEAEDDAGFNGDGTSTFGGISGLKTELLAGSIYDAATGNTAFSTLDLADFEGIVGQLPEFPGIRPSWYVHKTGYAASMMRLINAQGGSTSAELMAGPRREFLGFPVVFTQKLNKTLTAQTEVILLYFGDLMMGTLLGNRRGIFVLVSPHRYMELNQIGILGVQRFDINVHSTGTATDAGAVLGLKTPAS